MGGNKTIQKSFSNFRGKDLRSSDLTRDINSSIDFRNLILQKDGAIETRKGGKIVADEQAYLGLWTYSYSNTTTGATEQEIISLSDKLYKKSSTTLTVAYAGANSTCYLDFYLDTSTATFKCVIVEGTTTKLSYDVGTGLEAVPLTVTDLKTQIDAISGGLFTCTLGAGATTATAAFLPISRYQSLVGASLVLSYDYWTAINAPSTTFSTYYGARGNADFEHASACNYQDCLFVATGYEFLQKYDGQNVYRAGVPQPTAVPSLANGGGGNVDIGTHTYLYYYKQKDNRGNITEGVPSTTAAITLAGASIVNTTVTNCLAASGFNTNCGTVNGNQAGVTTITVNNSPHTLKTGDTAYFLDRSTSTYVERSITATTATTITISGAAVNVNNTDVISNNLRIVLVRTKVGGSDYYIVNEIPNNSLTSTQTYVDNVADANIGAQYFIPFKAHDVLSVKPRYVTTHQNLLIASGAFTDPNSVYFSYIEDLESFPLATNSFDLPSTTAGGVSGLVSDGEHLVIGKSRALYAVSGDLEEGTFRVDKVNEGGIGIACHNASADMGDGIIILSDKGWFLVQGGVNLQEIGYQYNKAFYDIPSSSATTLRLKRAWGIWDDNTERYFCFIPQESGSGTGRYANSNSLTYVFDQIMKGWSDYEGLNMGGGMCITNSEMYYLSKRDDAGSTVAGNLFKRASDNIADDYADHQLVISSVYGSQWDDGGEPSSWKFIPRMTLYSLGRTSVTTAFTVTVETELNYLIGLSDTTLMYSFNSGGSGNGWGLSTWGVDAWGDPVSRLPQPKKLKNNKYKSLRFVFTHGALHECLSISGWSYEVVDCYRKEMMQS